MLKRSVGFTDRKIWEECGRTRERRGGGAGEAVQIVGKECKRNEGESRKTLRGLSTTKAIPYWWYVSISASH